ncbi:EAL domain-containing protein [Phyllobacterium sp. K27]
METESSRSQDTARQRIFGVPVVAVIGLPLLTLLIVLFLGFGVILQNQRSELTKTYAERTAEFLARDIANQLGDLVTPLEDYADNLAARVKAAGCNNADCVSSFIEADQASADRIPEQVSVLRFGATNGHLFGIFKIQETDRDFKGLATSQADNPSRVVVKRPDRPTYEIDFNLFERGWYKGGMIDKAPAWSAPYVVKRTSDLCASTQGSEWTMTRVLRIDGPDRKPLGVLSLDMCISRIAAFLQGMTGKTVHEIGIFMPSGEELLVSGGQFKMAFDTSKISATLQNAVSLDRFDLAGWRVVAKLGNELSAQADWDWYYTAVCLIGLLISIALTAWAASFVVNPLMRLSKAVTDVGNLNLDKPISVPTGIKEIGLLASVIERMRLVLHRNQTRLEFLAYHDPASGFLNQAGLAREYDLLAARGGHIDLILIKICNYHQIASIFGDEVLARLMANRIETLQAALEGGVVGCLNNNLIAYIYPSDEGVEIPHIQKMLATIRSPYENEGIRISPVIACSVAQKQGQIEQFASLLRRANGAMHHAEDTKSEDAVWHNSALIQDLRATLDFGGDITRAIGRGEFSVRYHPVADLRTGRICEAHSSVIWHHPEFGDIKSYRFTPILEQNGSIRHLGLFIMSRSFEFLHHFKERYPDNKLLIGVNLSFAQLMDPLFLERVRELQAEWGVNASDVNFIITQNVAMLEDQQIFRVMRKLREIGYRLTIDHFAMAHATVNGATALQYDAMMIGSDVYRGIEQPGVERIILSAACELARKLGMERIAVGIDNHAIIEPLIKCGCNFGRGPWFGKSAHEQEFLSRYDENAAMFEPANEEMQQL